jgi:hypothetical protein
MRVPGYCRWGKFICGKGARSGDPQDVPQELKPCPEVLEVPAR